MELKPKSCKPGKQLTADGYAYLTKRALLTKAKAAGIAAAAEAMVVMGYVVTVKDGWLVKRFADGELELLEEI